MTMKSEEEMTMKSEEEMTMKSEEEMKMQRKKEIEGGEWEVKDGAMATCWLWRTALQRK